MSDGDYPRAVVRSDGEGGLILDDPTALGMIQGIGKVNCEATLRMNADRIPHFKRRVAERGMNPSEVAILVFNADDRHGSQMLDIMFSGHDWQAMRDRGEIPFGRGIGYREVLVELVEQFDKEAAEKLRTMQELVVLVVDHGVAEVFPA